MTPVYLQRGALHSALGADLCAANAALRSGVLPDAGTMVLHELQAVSYTHLTLPTNREV